MTRSRALAAIGLVVALVSIGGLAVVSLRDDDQEPADIQVAPATADFSVSRTEVRLPPRCRPEPVSRRLLRMLELFNSGHAGAFAEHFATPAFHPYSSRIAGRGFQSRQEITAFAAHRHRAGDAWSAARLEPPQGEVGLPREAVYGLVVAVSQHGQGGRVESGGAKIVVDCRTGLVSKWLGPSDGPPDVPSVQT